MDISRDPSDYRPDPSGHFRRRLRERDIPPTAIRRCIESGEVEVQSEGNKARVAFSQSYLGIPYTVVVNPNRGFAITVFTGWPDDEHDLEVH